MVTMRNPGRVGITVLVGDETPISKVQGNGRDANEGAEDGWMAQFGAGTAGATGDELTMDEAEGAEIRVEYQNWGAPSPCFS